jgi:hypothetical protein
MSKSHNKKRNVGIIYELLLRNISNSLIEGNQEAAQAALNIIEKRFDRSTEIYKEFRLFNALAKATVSDSSVAAAILSEAKGASRRCDRQKIDREKSLLIRDINHSLKDSSFYHRRIPEYKIYATIQTLLNDWRLEDRADLSRVVKFESSVVENLLRKKKDTQIEDHASPDVNSLVVKIMTEKINKKYKGKLTKDQSELIQEYVFSLSEKTDERIREKLKNVKSTSIRDLDKFRDSTNNNVLLEKIHEVKNTIQGENLNEISDESVSKFLVLIQLKKELREAINGR